MNKRKPELIEVIIFSILLLLTVSCTFGAIFGHLNYKFKAEEQELLYSSLPSISNEDQVELNQAKRASSGFLWLLFPVPLFGLVTLNLGFMLFGTSVGGGMGSQLCEDACP